MGPLKDDNLSKQPEETRSINQRSRARLSRLTSITLPINMATILQRTIIVAPVVYREPNPQGSHSRGPARPTRPTRTTPAAAADTRASADNSDSRTSADISPRDSMKH